ncbi:hypothetical protein L596_007941 [Steinernema carpocapsae]|uniref:Uncharacterized protein n=1 Tax=Steinernema carpocapsae TaxID=34508 RepID=A0A4U5PBY4_STECR|nr:hypothetical protein L596_007941 [Steinernema carpocapsae]
MQAYQVRLRTFQGLSSLQSVNPSSIITFPLKSPLSSGPLNSSTYACSSGVRFRFRGSKVLLAKSTFG